MKTTPLLATLALLAGVAPTARAQSLSDYAGYLALTLTPQGALPASTFGADVGRMPTAYDLRYGRISYGNDNTIDNFGISASARAGSGHLGGTIGAITCDGCDAVAMVGGHYEQALVVRQGASGALAIGIQPAIGFAKSTGDGEGYALSGSVGLPLSVTGGTSTRATAFLTPAMGYGRMSGGGESDGGLRPMLGGGIRVHATNGFGVLAGFQKTFIEDGEMVIGLGLSIAPPGR